MAKLGAGASRRRGHGFRPRLERFERRELLAVTVFTTNDSGFGSLRDAIDLVNAGGVADDTILFDIEQSFPGFPSFINLFSALPTITHHVIIDGLSQTGSSANTQTNTDDAQLRIALFGDGTFPGLVFGPGSDGSSVRGLNLRRFDHAAIEIQSNDVHVFGNYIGVDLSGAIPSNGNLGYGVLIAGGSGNTIGGSTLAERNIISGNNFDGVLISDGSANLVAGNFIGVDSTGGFVPNPDGSFLPGNLLDGVHVTGGAGNSVGGTAANARNVISGNRQAGVRFDGAGSGHLAVNNLVGLASDGTTVLGNVSSGFVVDGAANVSIGSTVAGGRNVVSANGSSGIATQGGTAPTNAVVAGNYIGLDASGTIAKPNTLDGVLIDGAGDHVGPGNVISGNTGYGVNIAAGAVDAVVVGSTIGLNASGAALPNGSGGVRVDGTGSTIGGTAADRNVISGNGGTGVQIHARASLLGNLIGLNPAGTAAAANAGDGVVVSGANDVLIDGATISGNDGNGIFITSAASLPTIRTTIRRSIVGLDATGAFAVPNAGNGVLVLDAAATTIGGSTASDRNVISGNLRSGVVLRQFGGSLAGTVVANNYVGTNASGLAAVGNHENGVAVVGSNFAAIGAPGAGNVISGNGGYGLLVTVDVEGSYPPDSTLIQGNTIGLGADGSTAVPNADDGVRLVDAAQVTIGGAGGARNVISSNLNGITILNGPRTNPGNLIRGNIVGLDATGLLARGNRANGIAIYGRDATTIEGGNTISANGANGIYHEGPGATATVIRGNVIGLDSAGNADGNGAAGIYLSSATGATIGGPNAGNTISANASSGILLIGAAGTNVLGNVVGAGLDGTTNRANALHGLISDGSANLRIGGSASGAGNVFAFNNIFGVALKGSSTGSLIQGNRIGTDRSGTLAQGNGSGLGILSGGAGVTVGGSSAGEGNVLSGNLGHGLWANNATGLSIVGNTVGATASGQSLLGNGFDGILLDDSTGNTVGGLNRISGNGRSGVRISGGQSGGNLVVGNTFGLAPDGSSLPASGATGITIVGSSGNTIGAPGSPNVVSNRSGAGELESTGIEILSATGNLVQSNLIGTDPTGTIDQGNNVGIYLADASGNTIGGPSAAQGNVISGNDDSNLYLFGSALTARAVGDSNLLSGSGSTANLVQNNVVGLAANGVSRLANQHVNNPDQIPTDPDRFTDQRSRIGVLLTNAAGNTITGNTITDDRIGVEFFGPGASGNILILNRIGLTSDGQILPPGQGIDSSGNDFGVFVNEAPGNTIGLPGQGNSISGNQTLGVELFGPGSTGNALRGNTISRNGDGVFLQGAANNLIGGATPADGNEISANRANGVFLYLRTTTGNVVASNRINRQGGAGVLLANTGNSNTVRIKPPGANVFFANRQGNVRRVFGPGPAGTSLVGLTKKVKARRASRA